MAQISKASRFAIITLAFTAGALVAIIALSSGMDNSGSNTRSWRKIITDRPVRSDDVITIRTEGLITFICIEFPGSDIATVQPKVFKKQTKNPSVVERKPLVKRPVNSPGDPKKSLCYRLTKGIYILKFKIDSPPADNTVASPSDTTVSLSDNDAVRLTVHARGGKVSVKYN